MFKPDEWCDRRVVPSPRHSGWRGFVISNGDVFMSGSTVSGAASHNRDF